MMQFEDVEDIPGTEAWSSDGRPLGRISAVHVAAGSVQPLLVQLPAGAGIQHLVPVLGAELRDQGLVLGYDAASIGDAPRVDPGAVLSIGEAAYALAHFGMLIESPGGLPLTERITGTGDVASVHPGVRALPGIRSVDEPGDPELPPIVIISPGADGADPRG
jgi:hypothetical protein